MQTIHFSTPLFKALPDSTGRWLAVELRNTPAKEVYFAVIDLQTGQLALEETSMEETWRIGLVGIADHFLLLHTHAQTHIPDHKGIYAVNINSQVVEWELPTTYFDYFAEWTPPQTTTKQKVIVGYQLQDYQKIYQLINLHTGQQLVIENRQFDLLTPLQTNLTAGVAHQPNSNYWQDFVTFLHPFLPAKVVLQTITYAENTNCFAIFAYYQKETIATHLDKHFFMFDREGKLLVEQKMEKIIANQLIDNDFLLIDNKLLVQQDSSSLLIFSI